MAHTAIEILGPGALLKKELSARGLTQRKLAEGVGMRPSHVSEIVSGKRPVTKAVAIKLQEVLGIEATVWLDLQLKAEVNAHLGGSEIEAAAELAKYDSIFSLKDFFKKNRIERKCSCVEKLDFLKSSIRTGSYENTKERINNLVAGGFFRRSEKTGVDARMIATWVVLAWQEALKIKPVGVFDRSTADSLVRELCVIFHENSNTIYRLMTTLSSYGINFCIVEKVEHASIDGYSFLENGVPTIAITKRYDRIDNLAFSVMHEVCHVYRHLKEQNDQRLNVVSDDFDCTKEETEANDFAANALIPKDKWEQVPQVALNNPWTIQSRYTKWAEREGFNKWIVLGRVSYETGMYKFRSDDSRSIK